VLSKGLVQKYTSYGLRTVSDIGGGDLMVALRLLITPGESRLGIGISVRGEDVFTAVLPNPCPPLQVVSNVST
jgi:hypothetical protein